VEAVEPALRETARRALAMAEKDQTPGECAAHRIVLHERLATWIGARGSDAALQFAERSVQYAGGRVTFQEPTLLPSYGWPSRGGEAALLMPVWPAKGAMGL